MGSPDGPAARTVVTPPGYPAAVWAPSLRNVPRFRLPRRMTGEQVLLASAHADDETLGAGGLVQAMHQRGARFIALIATDGAGAFPGLDDVRRRELAATREGEARAALDTLGAGGDVTFLRLPDGQAQACQEEIAFAMMSLGAGCRWWVAPWRHDPHPDHQAVGRAAAQSCPPGSQLVEYPIWMRHSLRPRDPRVPRSAIRLFGLTRGQFQRKQRAIAAHRSQVQIWDPGYEPVLPGHVLSLFRDRFEPFFVEER